jgi:hypothetical protein
MNLQMVYVMKRHDRKLVSLVSSVISLQRPRRLVVWLLVPLYVAFCGPAAGQELSQAAMKQANNPLASFQTLNFHNYYIPEVSGTDETANTFWVRYATPVSLFGGDWIVRASLPVQRVPTPTGSESGLGAANAFGAYLFDTGNPGVTLGAGPLVALPTSTGDVPGGDTWDLGAAAVLFNATSDLFQWGGLVTYQTDVAGSGESSLAAVQPFALLQMGSGWYLRSTGVWTFNFETNSYSVPVGFGLGKVMKSGTKVINAFIEPQATIFSHGPGGEDFQIFFGLNIQSYK